MESSAPGPRRHRGAVTALVILGVVIGIIAVFAVWANRQALETDTWTKTSSELLEDEDIRTAVAGFLVDELYANVDVQGELEKRLPPPAQPLAGPVAGGLRQLANTVALEILERPKIQQLWEDANRIAHEKLIAVIEDESKVLRLEGDVAVLDLKELLEQVTSQVGLSGNLVGKLPDDAAEITILRSDQIGLAQDGVRLLRDLAIGLSVIALGLFALAIYLARGWRRVAVRSVGIGFIIIGLIVLAARSLAGTGLVDALATTAAVEPAVDSTWEIGTSLLRASAVAFVGYGVLIVLGAWLAGPTTFARELRRGLTPYLRERLVAYAGIIVIIALVLWWNPTPGTSRLLPMLALIAILIAGVEGLRHQAVRDFPDAKRGDLRAKIRGAIASRRGKSPESGSDDAERLRQLERLADLRRAGVLSDEELAREKTRVLGEA